MINTVVEQTAITSAYIHIPFCSHKCEFCDFAAVAGMSHLEDEYTTIICREIEERVAKIQQPIRLSTIFYGGGTPGLASPKNLSRIQSTLANCVSIDSDLELSMETTPHAITEEKAGDWQKLGINRISIGIETLQQEELKAIGRDHSREEALAGLALASKTFSNVNIDFMYGLPTQTLETWTKTLDELVSLTANNSAIKHVSAYCLELAVNSPLLSKFPRSSPQYPSEDVLSDFFEVMLQKLSTAGFEHYEVSNFARPGFACRHNLIYWRNLPYLAFGVGAHRYVDGIRSSNYRSLAKYMRDCLADEISETIDEKTRVKEGVMLGLRMREGIDLDSFESEYGVNLVKDYGSQIEKLQSGGFISLEKGRLRITDAGVLLSNSILSEFM